MTLKASPRDALVPPLLAMLPFLVYFGSITNAAYNNNSLLLLAVFLIAVLIFLVSLRDSPISEKFYPFVIATISFSLLYQVLWISPYLVGYGDIHYEYFMFQLVKLTGRWNTALLNVDNSVLSVTILPAMVQLLLAIDGTSLFKTMYPLTFTFVPVVLFLAYRNVVDSRRAFLSTILFVSYTGYFTEVSFIGRQEIAELMVSGLLLLTYGGRNIKRSERGITMMTLIIGLLFAHYSSLFLYLGIVFLSFPLLAVIKRRSVISSAFIAIFLIFAICWYIFAAGGIVVTEAVQLGNVLYSTFFSDFFQPATRGMAVLMFFGIGITSAIVNWIDLMVIYSIQFCIIVGVLTLWKRYKSVNGEFLSYTSVSLIFVVSGIVVPYLASSLNETRIYQFALIFLSPACVLGGEIIFKTLSLAISILRKRSWHVGLPSSNRSLVLMSCVIILFLLFNTGFVNEISGAPPNTFALGMNRIRGSNDPRLAAFLYGVYIPAQDYAGARWFSIYILPNRTVCGDVHSVYNTLPAYAGVASVGLYAPPFLRPSSLPGSCTYNYDYVFLSYMNTVKGIVVDNYPYAVYSISDFRNLDYARNRIYSNGATVILSSRQ